MRKHWRASIALCLLGLAGGHAGAMSARIAAVIGFSQQSDRLDAEQVANLQTFACQVGAAPVEVVLVQGYSASDETQPEALAVRRARAVSGWLQAHAPWDSQRNAVQTQTVGPPEGLDVDEILLPLRLVVLDAWMSVQHGQQAMAADCAPPWKTALLASVQTAPTVARALVAGGFPADAPLRAALEARRSDIFAALRAHANLVLDRPHRMALALSAFRQGQTAYFLDWVEGEGAAAVVSSGERMVQGVCQANVDEAERLRAWDALARAGVRIPSRGSMVCP